MSDETKGGRWTAEELATPPYWGVFDEAGQRVAVVTQEHGERIARSVNAYEPMLAELRRLEWSDRGRCPRCSRGDRGTEHAPGCSLAAALRAAESPEGTR